MRQDATFFEDCEPRLVYIARKLADSLALETLLTEAGIDFAVEADRYKGGVIFQAERVGAFFYVKPEVEESARAFLEGRGYRPPAVPAEA